MHSSSLFQGGHVRKFHVIGNDLMQMVTFCEWPERRHYRPTDFR